MARTILALLPLVVALSIPVGACADDEEDRAEHREKMKEIIEEVAGEHAKFVGDRFLLVYVEEGTLTKEAIKIRNRLATQKLTLNFEETSFKDAIDFLRDVTTLNIVLSKEVQEMVKEEETTVTLKVKDIRLKSALNLLLDATGEELEWRIKNDVLFIQTREEGEEKKPSRTFVLIDISDILYVPPDYPAPELSLDGVRRKQ